MDKKRLAGYSSWGRKESDMTEQLSMQHSDYLLRPYLAITCGDLKKIPESHPQSFWFNCASVWPVHQHFFSFLFRNNHRFTGSCKDNIERLLTPCTQISPVVTSHITMVQDQCQESDIGIAILMKDQEPYLDFTSLKIRTLKLPR